MDLELASEDRAFRDELKDWLARNVKKRGTSKPRTLEPGAEGTVVGQRAWQRKLHDAGYVGIGWPREFGGRGASLMQQVILGEELSRHGAPGIIGILSVQMVGPTLIQWGTEAQKKRYLRKILTAEDIWCQGYSEPGAGSDLAALQTRAVLDGDHYVVNGQKIWTSNAHFADWMFCLVRTDPDAPKHRGISYLLIDMKSPGITVRPLVQMTKDAQFNEVFFDNVRVPAANIVGEPNHGWWVANTTLQHERNMLGSPTHSANLFDGLLRIARARRKNGRPATEDPMTRQQLAALKTEVAAMRLNFYRNLTEAMRGKEPGVEASITKLNITSLNHRLAEAVLELLGPYGSLYRGSKHLVDDGFWPYELMFSLGMIIGGGTSQIQKNIIAQRGLGLPRAN